MADSIKRADKPREALEEAIAVCRSRGGKITPLREGVLKALWAAERPMGAYDLKAKMSEALGRAISATSIYRTLDFLCEQGVAARIESRNAYVPCAHPSESHACVMFVCDACGLSSEIENKKLERLLAADAEELGFSINHRVVELSGCCADCHVPAD
ncbi:MAG: Fur family transcriptional regulator [Pseudomonadota bacterium]